MSTVSISYGSLKDASDEAKSVAKKIDKYADSLYDNVYKKLNKYDGSWSSNLTTAKTKTDNKISELRAEQGRYETYATNLIDLCDECKSVDKSVKSKVSSLTASFKEAHGIRNSMVENGISYFFTSFVNETAVGRWLSGVKDDFETGRKYLKDTIKEWYNYEGGKEFIKGILVGVLEVVIGVLTIVIAIVGAVGSVMTGGALLVLIAGVVGGIIAVANGIANICNESKAYSETLNGDPALGRRRSEINTCQDYLRSSFIYDDQGEKYEYNKYYHGAALGIDIVNVACTVITVASSVGNLMKNGYKWATGDVAQLKDIKLRKVFSRSTFTQFKTKFGDFKATFRADSWQGVKDLGRYLFNNFGKNLNEKYLTFTKVEEGLSSIKNWFEIEKTLFSGGITLSTIGEVLIKNIVFNGLSIFSVDTIDDSGVIKHSNVTLNDIAEIFEGGGKIISTIKDMIPKESIINVKVFNKLSNLSNIDIRINIPEEYLLNRQMYKFSVV